MDEFLKISHQKYTCFVWENVKKATQHKGGTSCQEGSLLILQVITAQAGSIFFLLQYIYVHNVAFI